MVKNIQKGLAALVAGAMLASCSTVQHPPINTGVARQNESIEDSARRLINQIKSLGEKHKLSKGRAFYYAHGYNSQLQSEVLFEYNESSSSGGSLEVAIINHPYSRDLPLDSIFRNGKLDIFELAKDGVFHATPIDVSIDPAYKKRIDNSERFGIYSPLKTYHSDPKVKENIDWMYATAIRTTKLSK